MCKALGSLWQDEYIVYLWGLLVFDLIDISGQIFSVSPAHIDVNISTNIFVLFAQLVKDILFMEMKWLLCNLPPNL